MIMQHDLKIILVDDDREFCESFSACFAQTDGLELVFTTVSAEQALAFIKEGQPDVVILDLELHKGAGNGILFLKELNEMRPAKRPYVLVNTNNSSRTTYDIVTNLGADFVMFKHQEGGEICRELRKSEKAPGAERIYTAGEKEYLKWQERKDKGVPVGEAIQKEFIALRDECGLDYRFPFED